jgi:hypothetical protein
LLLPWATLCAAALPELDIKAPAGFPYPLQLRLSQLFWTLFELFLMTWGLVWSIRTWGSVAARLAGMLHLGVAGLQVRGKDCTATAERLPQV